MSGPIIDPIWRKTFKTIVAARIWLSSKQYTVRMEANKLPIKYERKGEPTVTIASDDNGFTFKIVPYPSDKEIFKILDLTK